MSAQFDKEKTKKNIALIVEQIKNDADPELLNKYRSLFRKEVSLFHRSYTAAYLLMLYDQGRLSDRNGGFKNRPPAFTAGRGGKSGRQGTERLRNTEEARTETRQYPLPEEESRRLFISIGRNRRVFPREILGLINSAAAVAREDIGAIRILDNYSFVQVRNTVADAIIEALDGKPFRGRTLAVNYARSRRDEEEAGENDDAGAPPVDDNGGSGDTGCGGDTGGDFSSGSALEQGDDHPDEENI
jgi:hypothetical protein